MTEEPTNEQLIDACLWYRHDFGLLDEENKRQVMFIMREHWRAIWKASNVKEEFGKEIKKNNTL